MNKKEVKKINNHLINVELESLQKLISLVREQANILEQLECQTLGDFEFKVNTKTGFNNAEFAANALGFGNQYKKLKELEKAIGNKLTLDEITDNDQLKLSVTWSVKEKHTEYFSADELKVKKELVQVLKIYNSLDFNDRRHISFNLEQKLVFSPFSQYR